MDFDNRLYGMTTIIECTAQGFVSQGSGFFYNVLADTEPGKGPQWVKITSSWLITNRHVALPKINDKETIPDQFIFNFRQESNGIIDWVPIILNKTEFIKRLRLHINAKVDVIAVEIGDLFSDCISKGISLLNFAGLTNQNLPNNSKLSVEVSDDVLIAGYPRGFYDDVNMYPIVKSGIIASRWGANFQGRPLFLVDAKLFPGSSGSVVLSKPVNIAVINKKLSYNEDKQFVFLGIFSGEPFVSHRPIEFEDMILIKKDSFNVGHVWYSSLVPDIIENGISL